MRKDLGIKGYFFPMPVAILGTYDSEGKPDAMVAAWCGIYDTNQVFVCLASEHKTVENLKKTNEMTISFATVDKIKECDYLGVVSANTVEDKLAHVGFTVSKSTKVNAPVINELPISLDTRINKIYFDESGETTYVVLDILNVSADESILSENGKVDSDKLHLVSYDPTSHVYREIDKVVGRAFKDGLGL